MGIECLLISLLTGMVLGLIIGMSLARHEHHYH
jgi:hypothetical protein